MITPQRHVRLWLYNHHKSARQLSAMVGRSSSYVDGFLCPAGVNPVAIKALDKHVHFPPEIMREADRKIGLLHHKKRWAIEQEVQPQRNRLIQAWKAPKEAT